MQPKLYIITCADLEPGAQGCQGIHAALAFSFEHPDVCREWYQNSNYLAFLSVRDEREL